MPTSSPSSPRVLVSGPPGAGKSTVARLVAEGLERSVHVDADIVRESIVGGFLPPEFPFSDALVEQFALQREIVIAWADRMAAAGYVPVVDDAPIPPSPEFERQYGPVLGDPATVAVMLLPSGDATRARIEARNGPFDEFLVGVVDVAISMIADLALDRWHVIDSSQQSPTETAAEVLEIVRAALQ